jgi:uncharacterized membrane protein YhhN
MMMCTALSEVVFLHVNSAVLFLISRLVIGISSVFLNNQLRFGLDELFSQIL